MKNHFIRESALVLASLVVSVAFGHAQQPQPSPAPQATQSNQSQPSSQVQNVQQFTGMIVKQGKSFMLKDNYGALAYKLDDQSRAKDYVGKRVKINGILDSATRVLHVQSIETGS